MNATHEPFDTQASLHAVRALDGEDLRDFEAHLAAGCARCEAAVRQTEQALARAAMAGPPETPPPNVRDGVLRRAASAKRRVGWLPWAVGLATAAVAAGAVSAEYVASQYESRLGQMARETTAARERLAQSEATLREEVDAYLGAVELLRDPATRMVELRGQGSATGAVARVLWTDKAGGLLVATKLPAAPAGKAYALWTTEGEAPRAAGVFVPDESGRATLKVAAARASTRVVGVTLEGSEGAPGPTGPVLLAPR